MRGPVRLRARPLNQSLNSPRPPPRFLVESLVLRDCRSRPSTARSPFALKRQPSGKKARARRHAECFLKTMFEFAWAISILPPSVPPSGCKKSHSMRGRRATRSMQFLKMSEAQPPLPVLRFQGTSSQFAALLPLQPSTSRSIASCRVGPRKQLRFWLALNFVSPMPCAPSPKFLLPRKSRNKSVKPRKLACSPSVQPASHRRQRDRPTCRHCPGSIR